MKPSSLLKPVIFALAVSFAGAGCAGTTSASLGVSAVATTPSPELVYVSPGVYVVEDYDRAVFYSDGYFWRYDSGLWLRSSYYDSGFVSVGIHVVPRTVVRIDRPTRYVRYRGSVNARRRAVRRHRAQHQRQRARRDQVRDNRQHDRRDARRDRKQDKRDARRDRKQDKREARKDRKKDRREHRKDRRHKR